MLPVRGGIAGGRGVVKPIYTVDQIIGQLDGNFGWLGQTVTYSVPAAPPAGDPNAASFVAADVTLAADVELAFRLWDDLAAIDLVAGTGSTDISVYHINPTTPTGFSGLTKPLGFDVPGGRGILFGADIWIDEKGVGVQLPSVAFAPGQYGFSTYLHEIGHALGLSHPGPYNGGAPTYAANAVYAQDTQRYTVMSYFGANADASGTNFVHQVPLGVAQSLSWPAGLPTTFLLDPSTPMVDDVAAIQSIYGADMTTRTGNTVYGFNSNADRAVFHLTAPAHTVLSELQQLPKIFTIWDAGGVDTLDLSGYNDNQIINLAPGSYSSSSDLTNNIGIAFGATIENGTGGGGNDSMVGNDADNILLGNNGIDVLSGGLGNDRLDGGAGGDLMFGGLGDDTYILSESADAIIEFLGEGTDTVEEAYGNYVLATGLENLVLTGSLSINGRGNSGNNIITGNAGDNIFDSAGGLDTLIGGLGNDTYKISPIDIVIELADQGNDTLEADFAIDLANFPNFENVTLKGPFEIGAVGDAFDNVLAGNSQRNKLEGNDGNDTLITNGGVDALFGGNGDDTYVIGADAPTIDDVSGNDTVASTISRSLANFSGLENLRLDGIANIDATGDANANKLTGNSSNNALYGGEGVDFLYGGGGNDTLIGGADIDTLAGGAGDDTYVLDDLNDIITEIAGQGSDGVRVAFSYALNDALSLENITLVGVSDLTATGNAAANNLVGNDGANILDGLAGADRMEGGAGNDTYYVDDRSDVIIENIADQSIGGIDTVHSTAAEYTLGANVENLVLQNTASAVFAIGNGQSNILTGNDFANRIYGGEGDDFMYGGGGDDVYIVEQIGDLVIEFSAGPAGGSDLVVSAV